MASPTPVMTAASEDLTGRPLGPYRLIRRLGRGGMADVYLARQETLDRLVALKVLRADLARDEMYVKRFAREARAAAALSDAHIVQIIDVAVADGWHYIAQEYVPGVNLRQYLQRHGPLSIRLAVRVLDQVALALEKAERLSLVHRDIKPENVMLTRDGEVKVADFGLARAVGGGTQLALTQEGVTLGTPLYMSPEQIEGRPTDGRADLYSLGVSMFHLLAGVPPFDGESAIAVAMQHLHKAPPPLMSYRPDLPESLVQAVERLMAKRPEDRFPTASSLRKALRDVPLPTREQESPLWDSAEFPTEWPDGPLDREPLAETKGLSLALHSPRVQRRPWGRIAILSAVLFVGTIILGAYVGRRAASPPLVSRLAQVMPDVPALATPEAQYRYAMFQQDDPDAFRAVRRFHERPTGSDAQSELYFRLADQQVAYLYLEREQWDAALPYLERLYRLGEAEPNFYAFGAAGLARIEQARGRSDRASRYWAEAFRYLDKLPPAVQARVEAALPRGQAG